MNIVKHSKDSSLPQSQKKRFPYSISKIIPALLLASILGTYLDLFFVGKGLYSFPQRPFASVFSINISFTLLGLPLLIAIFLSVCDRQKLKGKIALIILLSLTMAVSEKFAETLGLFIHRESWKHSYSFIGYSVYLTIVYAFYFWSNNRSIAQ